MVMSTFDLAKKNYERGLWTADMLLKLVDRGKLTQEQYIEIVGVQEQE